MLFAALLHGNLHILCTKIFPKSILPHVKYYVLKVQYVFRVRVISCLSLVLASSTGIFRNIVIEVRKNIAFIDMLRAK